MVYCCVCGLPVDGVYYPETFDLDDEEIAQLYDKGKLSVSQLEWTRGFCTINERSFEEGERYSSHSLFYYTSITGESAEIRLCDPKFSSDGLFPDITSPESFFPIHCKCLTLVERVVKRKNFPSSEGSVSGVAAIQYFYESLNTLRSIVREDQDGVTGKGIEWKHDYYGARRFWFDSWTMEPGWEFLCADPFEIATLTDYLLSNLEFIPAQEVRQKPLVSNKIQQVERDCSLAALDALPIELLNKMVAFLPISSILRLHRTNQKLKNKISLNQTFWRDQLVSGRTVPFIWDLDREACLQKDNEAPNNMYWDWKALTRNLLEEPFVELALKNRLSQPLADDLGSRSLESWRKLSSGASDKLKGSPPLGLINRVRILKIIEEAIRMAENEK
ncbi:hypothetical protein BGZ60DRAFT_407612 [Tricladium varicosporioides]|nr:hypothetical protein BGZ60DRAFT_407612 [Hymenoscyphus varicosporioides]